MAYLTIRAPHAVVVLVAAVFLGRGLFGFVEKRARPRIVEPYAHPEPTLLFALVSLLGRPHRDARMVTAAADRSSSSGPAPRPGFPQGFAILRASGNQKLTVDRLCAAMKKTKGAFYHHFADIESFEGQLLAAWKTTHTLMPIEVAEKAIHREAQRCALPSRGLTWTCGSSSLIRAWSEGDPRARAARREVDETRVAYLASLWGHGKRARTAAEIEYAAFLGLLVPTRRGLPRACAHCFRTLLKALDPT